MNKKIFVTVITTVIFFIATNVFGLEPGTKSYHTVKNFIHNFKEKNKQQLLKGTIFPCNNCKQNRPEFDEVFDEYLSDLIISSDVIKDWNRVGWRGIMFKNGLLWLDDDGKISRINYCSKKLLEKDKSRLHWSIKDFAKPILEEKTKKRLVRIDLLDNNYYRYVEWFSYQKVSDKPHIIVNNGKITYDGSGGNHYYIFKNGQDIYKLYVNVIGAEDTPPLELEIYRKGILYEAEIGISR